MQHFGLADDCLRACVYADFIQRQNPYPDSAWSAMRDLCYSDAVITWNQLFGQKSQETHWSKLTSQIQIPAGDKLKPFNKQMIIDFLEISEQEWIDYHDLMVNMRNKRVVHLVAEFPLETMPNISKAMHCCYLYRDWLTEALHLGNRLGHKLTISDQRAQDVVKIFESQIIHAYKGMSPEANPIHEQ